MKPRNLLFDIREFIPPLLSLIERFCLHTWKETSTEEISIESPIQLYTMNIMKWFHHNIRKFIKND